MSSWLFLKTTQSSMHGSQQKKAYTPLQAFFSTLHLRSPALESGMYELRGSKDTVIPVMWSRLSPAESKVGEFYVLPFRSGLVANMCI